MTPHSLRKSLLLAAQAHGLYLRLRENLDADVRRETVATHAYSRYQRRLNGAFPH
ncbi:MAG TPA: hypothetical protein VF681_00220 [Abditibacteriaceae bacterium]|jgi:hypothetical protein